LHHHYLRALELWVRYRCDLNRRAKVALAVGNPPNSAE
jgi:hypothetical protein